jgi:predicted  nucleic acid-binding Zn-ribbon protein
LASEKDAEIQTLRRVIENADTEALKKLEEALAEIQRLKEAAKQLADALNKMSTTVMQLQAEIQHLKSARVKDIEDAWDAGYNFGVFDNCLHWVQERYGKKPLDKQSYIKQVNP